MQKSVVMQPLTMIPVRVGDDLVYAPSKLRPRVRLLKADFLELADHPCEILVYLGDMPGDSQAVSRDAKFTTAYRGLEVVSIICGKETENV